MNLRAATITVASLPGLIRPTPPSDFKIIICLDRADAHSIKSPATYLHQRHEQTVGTFPPSAAIKPWALSLESMRNFR